jgi:hypothetical protein
VTPFNLTSCPDGWTDYFPAEGKFPIGVDNTPWPFAMDIIFMNTATRNINLNIGQQSATGIDDVNIPPYLALKYCEKLPR